MSNLDALKNGITDLLGKTTELVQQHPAAAVGVGVAGGVGVGTGIARIVSSRKKRKKKNSKKARRKGSRRRSHKRITHTSRGWKQDRKRRSKQKWEVAYQKRKKKHSKPRRLVKGSKEAKAYMAKLRRMRK